MIDPPQVTELPPLHYARRHLVVPREQIRQVMGPTIREVYAAVTGQGASPSGPWFTHHLRRPNELFDFEACVPVAAPIAPHGEVTPGLRPALRVARTTLRGDYAGLAAAWGELLAWVAANGHRASGELWEVYTLGPESSPTPADWRTELLQPLEG